MLKIQVSGVSENGQVAAFLTSKIQSGAKAADGLLNAQRIRRFVSRSSAVLACWVVAFLVLMPASARLSAQTFGSISGHISDATGAVIPGATVTLTNTATNTSRSTVTTAAGDYTFPDVPTATYAIKIERSGFKIVTTSVDLQMQQSLRQDFTMSVGDVTQTVTVEALGALLQTDNPTLGTVVPTETISEMPINNRNYLNLVAVSANTNVVSPTQGQAGSRLGGARASQSISVGGSRIMFDHYTLDGINNTDPDFNTFVVQPSIEAIQEMKVQTGVYSSQFGYNATQVNVVSKSGGNQFHGTASDYVRNNYVDALGYNYNYPNALPKTFPYKYNDYGFVLAGPIWIPHVFNGRNRFFFMVNDEWYSQISLSQTTRTQPTQAELNGDLSGYGKPIYDPATGNADGTGRTQFVNNNLAGRIDPISLKFIQLYDAPAQNSSTTSNYTFLTHAKDTHDGFNVRGDFDQSAKSQFAFRFSNGLETNPTAGFVTSGGTVGSNILTRYYQYMGSHTWTISPTVVNVATFGYTSFFNSLGLFSQGIDDDVTKVGIPNLSSGASSTWGIPAISYTGDIFTGLGDSTDGPYVTTDPNTTVNDNINWVHGKHSIDLGFQYERQVFNELGNQQSRGNFVFQANATARVTSPGVLASGTGSAFADFLLGQIDSSTYSVAIAKANYVRNVESGYFDDNYKVTPKLSIQLGLRYELTPPWFDTLGNEFMPDFQTNHTPISPTVAGPEPSNLQPAFVREGNCNNAYQGTAITWVVGAANNPGNPNSPVQPGPRCANGDLPNSMVSTSYLDFAPRIGISYSPTSTIVIRAGYGLYYDHDTANARFDVARNLAGRVTLSSGNGAAGVATLNWGNAIATGQGAVIPPPYSYANEFENKTANTEIYLIDIQKQVGQSWQFEAGYLGSQSNHLNGFRNANYTVPAGLLGPAGYYPSGQTTGTCTATSISGCGGPKNQLDRTPYPNYGVVQMVHDIGISNYNAFTFQVNKRFSGGFNLVSSYTFAKSLDDTSGIRTQSSKLFPQSDLCITCEYGPSDFDVKHRVVVSAIYHLPVGAGLLIDPKSKALDAVIGGWELSGLVTLQTGVPYNESYTDNVANTNTITGGTYPTRPNYVSGQPFVLPNKTPGNNGQWVNLAAWQEPAAGFLGTSARNMLYGPGYQRFDLSLDKNFNMPYNEHHQFQIRFDAFNALNHTNFGNPNASLTGTSTPGKITGSNAPAGSANGGSRELQLGAKYSF